MLVLPILLAITAAQCNSSLQPAVQALRENNTAQASAILQSIPTECQQSSSFFALTGLVNAISGNASAAETALRKAISLNPKSVRLREQLGAIYLRDKKAEEAADELKKAVALDPSNAVIKKYLIGAYVETGKWQGASALFDQIGGVGSDTKDPIMILWFARTMIETKQFGRLDRDISPEQTGMSPALLFSLGTLFAEHAMYEKAVRYFKKIPAKDADDAVYFNLGLAYSHLRSFEEARRNFFRAIDKNPKHVEAYFRIGLDYSAAGQGRMAVPWLFRAEELAPNRPDIAYALAEQLLQLKYFESARKIVAGALAIAPTDPILLVASADLQQEEGHSAAAIGNYKKALTEHPKLVAALVGLARASAPQDNLERKYLQEALSIEPGNPSANGELGLLYAQGDDWVSALRYLSKAWGADRSNKTVGLRLAQALRHTGRAEEALQLLKSQQSSMEDSSAFHLELGQVYLQLHRPAEAHEQRDLVARLEAQAQDSLRFDKPATYAH